MYALKLSTTTVEEDVADGLELEFEEDSRIRSSSERCPEKDTLVRKERGLGSREKVENAVTNPVGKKGSSMASSPVTAGEAASFMGCRSEVTRGRGLSCARKWKRW